MYQFRIILGMIFMSAFFFSRAQELKINLPQMSDRTLYLGKYFGPNIYFADTAELVNHTVVFNTGKHKPGLYALLIGTHAYAELILDREAGEITIADTLEPMKSATVLSGTNNIIFYEYIRYMGQVQPQLTKLEDAYKSVDGKPKKQLKIRKKIRAKRYEINQFRRQLIVRSEGLFVKQLLCLAVEPEIPPTMLNKKGAPIDSMAAYHYYMQHYWDGVDFKNPGLVNTPIYLSKLDTYFSGQVLIQHPDTLIKYSAWMLGQMDQVDQTNYVFQVTLNHLAQKYESMNIMGMDKVFWYLGKFYYCFPNNKAWWAGPDVQARLCDRIGRLENVLIGDPAVPLALPDTTEKNWIRLYDIKAKYTVLFFWEPNCGHCKTAAPLLQLIYEKKFKERGVEVYAVAMATGSDFEDWKKFIRDEKLTFINVGLTASIYDQAMKDPLPLLQYTSVASLNYTSTYDVYSTPKIFVLDETKHILFKQLAIDQLEYVLDDLTGHASDEKLVPPGDHDHDH